MRSPVIAAVRYQRPLHLAQHVVRDATQKCLQLSFVKEAHFGARRGARLVDLPNRFALTRSWRSA